MTVSGNILVIDDDESMRIGCMQTLTEEGYRVRGAANGQQGLNISKKESFDLVLLDLKMPGIPGMEVLGKLKEGDPYSIVIVITGYGTIESAVEAMKSGAYDFLTKPFTPETLIAMVAKAMEHSSHIFKEPRHCHARSVAAIEDAIIGHSEAIMHVVRLIKKVAPIDSTVLITGDTGGGKELVARTIHQLSTRHDKPFITVDCGALVETLFESEVFGHVKGSFTGATDTTRGKFELADGGSLFLDEITNISFQMQARLLRVIQEREIFKIGSEQKISVDVRIIAATNRDLMKEIRDGRFREDLFYRLNVVHIHIPPLRDRREDIPELAYHFLKRLAHEKKKDVVGISDTAMRLLTMYDWPGNVRELINTIERAVVVCDSTTIEPDDLPFYSEDLLTIPATKQNGLLAQVEKDEIARVLKQCNGHMSKAAESLGINRKTLREKIRKYNIAL